MNPLEEDRALNGETASFDDSRRAQEAMDPMTRNLLWIAGGIALLLAIVIGGWAISGRHSGGIPIVEAPAGPTRIKPLDPGGMNASSMDGLPSTIPDTSAHEALAPQPETPRPDELKAQVDAARRSEAEPPGSAPSSRALSPRSIARPHALARNGTQAGPPPVPPTVVEPVTGGAGTLPPPVPPAAAHPAAVSPDGGAGGLRTEAAPAAERTPGRATGHAMVQLAALGSDHAAQAEWSRLRRLHPSLLASHSAVIQQAEHGGRTIYRLRTRGFASDLAAAAFCNKAHGEGMACTVADF